MTTDAILPAIRMDIAALKNQIEELQKKWSGFEFQNEQWKQEWNTIVMQWMNTSDQQMEKWMNSSDERMEKWKNEMNLFFAAALEQVQDAVKVINLEKIRDHDDRIIHLEMITGVRE